MYERYQSERRQNPINLCIEYLNDRRLAKERYGGTALYDETIAKIDEIRHGVDRPESGGRTRATSDGECLDHRCRPLRVNLGRERDKVSSPDLSTNSVEVGELVGLPDRICDQGGEGGVR